MGRDRLPNEIETDELLKVLEKDTKETVSIASVDSDNDLMLFVSYYKIRPGKHAIRKNFFYKIYLNWSRNPVSRFTFYTTLNRFLVDAGNAYTDKYYLIDQNYFNLAEKAHELLKEVKRDKTKSVRWKQHFEAFLRYYNIKPGKFWITFDMLYFLYDKWTYITDKKAYVGSKQLNNLCMLYFKYRRRTSNEMKWFAVDKSIVKHLTPGQRDEMKEKGKRNDRGKKNKKK